MSQGIIVSIIKEYDSFKRPIGKRGNYNYLNDKGAQKVLVFELEYGSLYGSLSNEVARLFLQNQLT